MYARFPTYAAILSFLVFFAATACNRGSIGPTSPGPSTTVKTSLTAEPVAARPEFLSNPTCPTHPSFGIRITVIVGGNDLIVRGIRFAFTDRFGSRALPDVFPTPAGSTSIPSSSPIPIPGSAALPGSSPIPIPGSSPINGVLVSDGTRLALPFFLRFGCDVVPEGTIIIIVDTADRTGRPGTSEVRVAVRQ